MQLVCRLGRLGRLGRLMASRAAPGLRTYNLEARCQWKTFRFAKFISAQC